MNLIDLQTFVLVAEMGTITAAASKMNMPKSTISRRIKKLEEELGISLLHRASRKTVLTSDGQVLFQRVASAMEELNNAGRFLKERSSEPTGTLRISTTYSYGRRPSVVRCIAEFKEKYPKVQIELILNDRVIKLEEDNIDVAFRLHTHRLPGGSHLMTRKLHDFILGIYASPEYLSTMGAPKSTQELLKHRIISNPQISFEKEDWFHIQKLSKEQINFPKPHLIVNDRQTIVEFALASVGLIIEEEQSIEKYIATGQLIRILPDYEQKIAKSSIVWINNKHMSQKIRAFIDYAVECLGAHS
jgi:LysR family transcriptional regulator for bpeEF and oprC